jgi:hypothetical protein
MRVMEYGAGKRIIAGCIQRGGFHVDTYRTLLPNHCDGIYGFN